MDDLSEAFEHLRQSAIRNPRSIKSLFGLVSIYSASGQLEPSELLLKIIHEI
jgi:hypothetical protein